MRNIVSHGIIVTFIGSTAHYTNLAREAAHKLHADWLLPQWTNDFPLVLNVAFAIVCIPIISHAIPIIARIIIAICNAILAVHQAITTFWRKLCVRVEQALLTTIKSGLLLMLGKIEVVTNKVTGDEDSGA